MGVVREPIREEPPNEHDPRLRHSQNSAKLHHAWAKLASPTIGSSNQLIRWLREMAGLRLGLTEVVA